MLHPSCTGLKGFMELNAVIHPETFRRNRNKSIRIGRIAGRVAIKQSSAGRHWFVEQPKGSDMYHLPEWTEIAKFACWIIVFMCAAGMVGERTGLPIMKPTEVWASDWQFIEPLRRFMVCRCVRHAQIGNDESSVKAQVWPEVLPRRR